MASLPREAGGVDEGKRPGRTRLCQTGQPHVDRRLRFVKQPAQEGVAGLRGHFHVRDDSRAVIKIVEHQEGVGDHEDGVGQLAVVRWRVGQVLDGPHDVVAQVPHGAPGETRKPWHLHGRMPPQRPAQMLERCDVALHHLPAGGGSPPGALAAAIAEHLAGIRGQKCVAGPSLTPLQRLEEKTVWSAVQLGERGDGRVAVENDLPGNRQHAAAGTGPLGERREALAHCGAATR